MTPKQQYKPGERKISETFLRFAAPILEDMPEEATSLGDREGAGSCHARFGMPLCSIMRRALSNT